MLKRSLVLAILIWAPLSYAPPGPSAGSYRIESLFNTSDAVCAGTVRGVRDAASLAGAQSPYGPTVIRTFSLATARCYKGALQPDDDVQYTTYERAAWPANGDYGLLVIKRSSAGIFTLMSPWGNLDDASLSLLAPLESSGTSQLETDLLFNLRALSDPEAVSRQLRMLQGFDHLRPATIAIVRPYTKDTDRRVATAAFAVLARTEDPADLAALCQYAQDPKLDEIAWQYGFNLGSIRKQEARQALECLAGTQVRALNYEAVGAVRAMRSPASVPGLMRLLDHPDQNMQSIAYNALCEIVQRKGYPALGGNGFLLNRAALVASWRQWWNETGMLQYPDR
jgi:hypothetical protein